MQKNKLFQFISWCTFCESASPVLRPSCTTAGCGVCVLCYSMLNVILLQFRSCLFASESRRIESMTMYKLV